jgi:putative transposase
VPPREKAKGAPERSAGALSIRALEGSRWRLRWTRALQSTTFSNAYGERLVGTVRHECLDFMIPLNERHLRMTLRSWVTHYNKGRLHSSLGPGIPETALGGRLRRPRIHGRRLPRDCEIRARDILGGLHHEYRLEERVA